MSKIISIEPRPLKWLVGHSEEINIRLPFSAETRRVTAQCIPRDAVGPISEGGESAIVTLSCSHTLEWKRSYKVYYSSLEEWVRSLQDRIGRRIQCQQCMIDQSE